MLNNDRNSCYGWYLRKKCGVPVAVNCDVLPSHLSAAG